MISPAALQAVSQASAEVRTRAEQEAVSEISAYLRPAYDCDAIFSASGDDRSPLIVMYACDIALYHMAAALPQKLGSEIRAIRYDRAVKWLEGVQAGKILPDLPPRFLLRRLRGLSGAAPHFLIRQETKKQLVI